MALFADPEQKKREQLIIALFIIGVAVQFYFYHSGVIGRVYQENIGDKDGMIILGGLAKYLHLFGGIAAAYLVSFLMYMLRFGTLQTIDDERLVDITNVRHRVEDGYENVLKVFERLEKNDFQQPLLKLQEILEDYHDMHL